MLYDLWIYEPNHKPEIKLDTVVESYCTEGCVCLSPGKSQA